MNKLNEIALLEKVKDIFKQLVNAQDSYVKEFSKKYLHESDIDKMQSNISNDFPVFLNTRIERIIDVYHDRCRNLLKIIAEKDRKIYLDKIAKESLGSHIDQLNAEIKTMKQFDEKFLREALQIISRHSNLYSDMNDLIYNTFSPNLIIKIKAKNGIPFSEDDLKHIMDLTNNAG